ncbi:c-type cytochrome, partial [bacterium]|nr:c-type cytochrome [bacterium]
FRYLLEDIVNISEESNFWSFSLLRGVANGMPRHSGGRIPPNLSILIEKPPSKWEKESRLIGPIVKSAIQIANDPRAAMIDRFAAIACLANLSGSEVVSCLIDCLDRDQPLEIQYAANDVILTRVDEKLLLELISRWDRLTTQTKQTTIPLFLQRGSTILALLDAIDAKKIPAGTIGVDQRAILLASGNATIKSRSEMLFGGAVSSDRQAIMEQYRTALTTPGDVERGRQIYRRACSNCHRVFGEGKLVGPDIGDVRNKTPEQLLGDIIDPNRIVEPRYASCTVLLQDGRSMTGRVLRETPQSIVLLQAGAVETVVPRAEIDTMTSSGKSLMTVGIEKDVSVQEMADLITFLKAGR